MSCILCFTSKDEVESDEDDFFGIYDYNEHTLMSAVELIKLYLSKFADVS